MSTTIEREKQKLDPIELVKNEIKSSRDEHRPISRQLLADLVATRTSIKMDKAWLLVDEYCAEHEAGIPGYLRQEFNLHWLKVIGVLLAVASMGVAGLGIRAANSKGASWPFFAGATLVLGLGILLFVHSLESFQKVRRERREQLLR
jgi:hypothetical protein